LGAWEFERHIPTAVSANGAAITFHTTEVSEDDDLIVVYKRPWQTADEVLNEDVPQDLIVPVGAEDLPSLWAAAFLVSGREISRTQIDDIESWATGAPMRFGNSDRLIRQSWQTFYSRVDEVKKIHVEPHVRPFIKMRSRL
jgi:hypothetical protein